MNCTRCEVAPRPAVDPELVAVYSPVPHLLAKTRTLAMSIGAALHEAIEGLVVLKFPAGEWTRFLRALGERTTQTERCDMRLTSLPSGGLNGLALARAAFSAPTAEHWCAQVKHGWLIDVLERRELFSHYQPIVDARTRAVHGYEALIRASGADGSVIPAGSIVDAARQLDLLFVLDQQARASAIRNAPVNDTGAEKLFINFLPTVIYDPAMCLSTTWRALENSTVRPENVVFEVVESDSVADLKDLIRILEYYREKGFRIALDDLGSGYSSLNLLSELRPDYVKLDMELVRAAPSDSLRAGMLDAITRLAQQNGIQVIAEGIETEEQVRFLQGIGVNLLQGYFFSRPSLSPEVKQEAMELLAA